MTQEERPGGGAGMAAGPVRFGPFELDAANYRLRRAGRVVKLERIPMEVLLLLAARAGQLVTRDEIVEAVWGKDVFLDVGNAVNTAVRKIRRALEEDPEKPRYLETVTGKGYRFQAGSEEGAGRETAAGVAAGAEREMLAVLPLDNLTGDPGQEYFAEGMTEELIAQLGRRHRWLGVIARTSVMAFKHSGKRVSEIGRELGVNYIVEGSVRTGGGQVRVVAQLIQVSDETHVWADHFDGRPDDVLKLQERAAIAIAEQIGVRLSRAGMAGGARARAVNPAAIEAYLLGRQFWNQKTEDGVERSIERFRAAVELDAGFARAHAGLADAFILLGIQGFRAPADVYPKAEAAARRSLELDDAQAEAQTSLAEVEKDYNWNWEAAEAGYRRALEIDGNYAVARHWYADYLSKRGRHEEAIREIEAARRLDPLSGSINAFVCYTFYRARQFQRAVEEGRRAAELYPHFPLGHYFLGLAHVGRREYEEAAGHLERASRMAGERPFYLSALGHALAGGGRRAEALAVAERLKAIGAKRYVSPLDVAMVYAGLGEAEDAFAWLERAYRERATRIQELPEAAFDGLRSDPRMGGLLARIGLAG